ncbi:MAG TPA: type II secretion system major pseudopilin GspG [Planctomycetota bacterium]|nr:type II secretion system major pseudopilin GspG [Planctomycetota bacterium]
MNSSISRTQVRPEAGFTLVEIMVVVVILGLLATLVVQNVIGAGDTARETKAKADVRTIADAIRSYRTKNGKFPESLDVLATKDERGRSELEELPKDPWDHEYILREGDRPTEFEVISMGPDGSENTEDDISSKTKKDK